MCWEITRGPSQPWRWLATPMKTCVFPAQVLHPHCTRLFHVYVHGQFKFDLPCFKMMALHAATCYWYFRSPLDYFTLRGGAWIPVAPQPPPSHWIAVRSCLSLVCIRLHRQHWRTFLQGWSWRCGVLWVDGWVRIGLYVAYACTTP